MTETPECPESEVAGPRTYQSAWQWNEDGTTKLMTAEDWLIEEADVDAALDAPTMDVEREDDGPDRGGILRAIADEIATLRRERSQWAEAYTTLVAARSSSLGEPVSQEAPIPFSAMPSYVLHCDAQDVGQLAETRFKSRDRISVMLNEDWRRLCAALSGGIPRTDSAPSVISSASPLSEDERERLVEAVCSARYQKNHAKGERLRREWNETYEERLVRLIDRLSASAPSPEDAKPKPRALRQVRPHTVGSAYVCGRCAKSHVVGCDANGIVGGRLCPNSPSPEDKGSKHPRLDEPCAKHPEFLNRDCPHAHIWPNGAPT